MASSNPRRTPLSIAIALALVAADAWLPPQHQVLARGSILLVDAYQVVGRPISRRLVTCRFDPTCSDYSKIAFTKYGFWRGLWLTAGRLSRCRASTPLGTTDPP